MAHNLTIDTKSQEYAMFVAGAAAWHKLGQNVADAQTWADAMKLAHLDFTLSDEPIRTDFEIVASHKAIVRNDTQRTVGIVGTNFATIQPFEAFKFVDTLIETRSAHYVSAGLLADGARMWVLARVPAADISVGDDKSQTFLMFAQGFDGSLALIAKLTSVRVVCQNTLMASLADGNFAMKIKHTSGASARLKSAEKLLSGVAQNAADLEAKLRKLAARQLKRESITAILDRVFPKNADVEANQTRRENVLSEILTNFESNDNNAFPEQRGTAYNLLNAITDYTDHTRAAKANGHSADFKRAESAMFGTGAILKSKALDVIYTLTDGTEETRTVYSSPTPNASGSILDSIIAGN